MKIYTKRRSNLLLVDKVYNTRRKSYFGKRKRLKTKVKYTQESINKIIYNVKLSTVIGEYTTLTKRKNGDYVGGCPLCRTKPVENDRCFRVSDKKSLFKCFSCGIGGRNGAGFLLRMMNQPFDVILRFMNHKYFNNTLVLKENEVTGDNITGETNFELPF
jgi:DNA primase